VFNVGMVMRSENPPAKEDDRGRAAAAYSSTVGLPHGIPSAFPLELYSIWQNGFISVRTGTPAVGSACSVPLPGTRSLCIRTRAIGPYENFAARRRIGAYYSRNPFDSNSCRGTSIGENFNCSFAPISESNLK
jgi:hypothetical protein